MCCDTFSKYTGFGTNQIPMHAAIVQISGNTEVVSPPLIIAILSPLLYILVFLGSRELYNLVLISWGKDGQRLV